MRMHLSCTGRLPESSCLVCPGRRDVCLEHVAADSWRQPTCLSPARTSRVSEGNQVLSPQVALMPGTGEPPTAGAPGLLRRPQLSSKFCG